MPFDIYPNLIKGLTHLVAALLTLILLFFFNSEKAIGQIKTVERENELFQIINLDHPGLEAVKQAEINGDRERAKEALITHYRLRQSPKWRFDPSLRPQQPEFCEEEPTNYIEQAQKVLERRFTCMGKEAVLPKRIDWDVNPVGDGEWTSELNQHFFWIYLGRAYWETYDERYAEDFVGQLRSWLEAYPTLDALNDLYGWRSPLRAAARMAGPWFDAFCYFSDSPSFTIQDKISMLHSIAQHAEYLLQTEHTGNAFVSEMTSLLKIGVHFPEFRNASAWRNMAISMLSDELSKQIYPDGAQIELTPHYHIVSLCQFAEAYELAKKYGIPLPMDFEKALLKMFDCLLRIVKPDLSIPMLNDSDYADVTYWMQKGARLFGRDDMRFVATGGGEGKPPEFTSYAMPYAGWYVNRSGWDKEARYLLFEAGPFGLHHHHEDKLLIDLYAYGRSLLMDPGRYTYVSGPWRSYFLGTESHNTIVVDGSGQRRRQLGEALWVTGYPLDNRWISNSVLDFAVGSYSDGYELAPGVVHVRRVLFVKKGGYWVVSDRLYEISPAKNHEFRLQFQFSTSGVTVHSETKIAESNNEDANLMIIPVMPEGVGVNVFEGQTDPPRGWIGWDYHKDLKTPASQVVYKWEQACPANADVVLVPFPNKTKPVMSVTVLPEHGRDVTALEIQTKEGIHRIFMRHNAPKLAGGAQENPGNEETEVRVSFFNLDRQLESTSAVYTGFLMAEPVSLGRSLAFEWINENTVKVSWLFGEDGQDINRINVDYGHAEGGGYIFRKPVQVEAGKRGEMTISGLSAGRNYICRAWAEKAGEATGVLLAEGCLKFPSYFSDNADSDKDGMPDGWEARHGLNPYIDDSMLDADRDGATNMAEYRKGTVPNDRRSRPKVALPWIQLLLDVGEPGIGTMQNRGRFRQTVAMPWIKLLLDD